MGFIIFVLWLFFCAVAARMADKKGNSGWGYFFIAFLFSPLVGIICAALADTNQAALDRRLLESNRFKRCPHCRELIKREAEICRYCHRDFPRLGNL